MPWRRGDLPLTAAPEYEDYLFEQWSHGVFDDFWKQPGIYAEGYWEHYADVPVVHLSGWYDPYARTAVENYLGLSRRGRAPNRLILGPWTHGDRSLTYAGDVEFGAAWPRSTVTSQKISLRAPPLVRPLAQEARERRREEPPVRVFVMGGGSGRRNPEGRLDHGGWWRYAAERPLPQTLFTPYYLHADRSLARRNPVPERRSRIPLRSARSDADSRRRAEFGRAGHACRRL